jgi:nicotinamidase-related amidase
MKSCLLVIDCQNDFILGSLPVPEDACKGVNVRSNDSVNAIIAMINKGIKAITSAALLKELNHP